jgi:hypothetical protein
LLSAAAAAAAAAACSTKGGNSEHVELDVPISPKTAHTTTKDADTQL